MSLRAAALVATSAVVVAGIACHHPSSRQTHPVVYGGGSGAARQRTPDVQLWLSGDNFYRRGERARVFFRTDDDAYVFVVRIDTDGRMRVLFPESPVADNFVRGGVTYRAPGYGRESFYVDDYPGLGYVFAIASWRRLDLEAIGRGTRWDYQLIGDRVSRDPFTVIHDLAQQLTGDGRDDYAVDVAEYHVDRRSDYPRFLCYDCHAHRAYHVWNPYAHRCAKFRLVIYTDPFYYPYRYYRGTRVVYVRDQRRWPRYELKETSGRLASEPFIEHRRRIDDRDGRRSTPVNAEPLARRSLPGAEPTRRIPTDDSDRGIIRRTPTTAEPGEARPPTIRPPRREREDEPSDVPRREPSRSEPERRPDPPRSEPERRREPITSEPDRVEPRRETPRDAAPDRVRTEPRRETPRESPAERARPEPSRESPRQSSRDPRVSPRRDPRR